MNRVLVLFFTCASFLGFSQTYEEYQKKYNEAKILMDSAKYEEAAVAFDHVSQKVDYNPFMPYARFYKATCFKKLEKYAEARFVLSGLIEEVKKWNKLDEVNYLLTEVNLELGDYEQAIDAKKEISNEELENKSQDMLYHFIALETDLEKLKKVQELNKKDETIAKICAYKIERDTTVDARFFLRYLIQDYELDGFVGSKKGEKKDSYKVAVMIPFGATEYPAFKRTKFLDLYQGILMAKDSLKEAGVNVEFEVYDTRKSVDRVKQILANPAFEEFDLILGPMYSNTSKVVAEYADKHQIVMFNIFNRTDEISKGSPYVFSSSATLEVIGRRLAEDAVLTFDTTKKARIYYHLTKKNKKDSIVARSYQTRLKELGVEVSLFKSVGAGEDEMRDYRRSLEWTRQSENGHVAVFARKSNLMASTLVSVWETEDKKIPVLVPAEWMDISLINYEQFYRRDIHLYSPEYVDLSQESVDRYKNLYRKKMNMKPIELESFALGFDLTLYCGLMLNEYGTFFHEKFNDKGSIFKPVLVKGLSYNQSYSNIVVPIIKFDEELNLLWVNSGQEVEENDEEGEK